MLGFSPLSDGPISSLPAAGGGPVAYADSLSVGTYAISGNTVSDSVTRDDALAVGAYVISGKDVTDVVTTAGTAHADTLSAGGYAIAGQSITDSKAYADSLNVGAYSIAGQSVIDVRGRADSLAPGAYVYTGNDLTDVKTGAIAYADSLNPGAYLIDGQSLTDSITQTSTKHGGDDAFHHPNKHTGWNKQAWKKKSLREDAIESTIEATYKKILGIEPAPEIIAEIKREARAEIQNIDYTQERKFIDWLSAEIQSIRNIEQDIEDDDEDAIMLLMG